MPLGTAGSVKQAPPAGLDETFLVISADALTDFDLDAIIDFHKNRGATATLTLYRVPNPLEYGVVIIDAEGRIRQFLEKPSWGEVFSDTVNTGIYILEPKVLDYIPADKVVDFSQDVFPQLLANNDNLFGFVARATGATSGTSPSTCAPTRTSCSAESTWARSATRLAPASGPRPMTSRSRLTPRSTAQSSWARV